MLNIQIKDWPLQTSTGKQEISASFTILVECLDSNLKKGDLILKKDIIAKFGVNHDTFRTMMGKSKNSTTSFLK